MIHIDNETIRFLASRMDEAGDLIANEFKSLDIDQQYRNSFSRLLKWDPLERVLMLGTDQRDLFIPALRKFFKETVPASNGHIFDFGCGDGLTFELAAKEIPQNTVVSFLDSNSKYVEQYKARLQRNSSLIVGEALVTPFDEVNVLTANADVALGIHMIYFVADLQKAIVKMYSTLKEGGALFLVFAEENSAYTGCAARYYYKQTGKQDELSRLTALCQQRIALLGSRDEGGGQITAVLNDAFPDSRAELFTELQASRLYGHSMSDIIALANIAELAAIDDLRKFETTKSLIERSPSTIDLRLEECGPRAGMLSVAQPQRIAVIRKNSVRR
ncbi:MAG: methyltransferase [Lentisphaeraceae bacterium]|nr:methyltransferase [Lentisphaeraceae bacterium]